MNEIKRDTSNWDDHESVLTETAGSVGQFAGVRTSPEAT